MLPLRRADRRQAWTPTSTPSPTGCGRRARRCRDGSRTLAGAAQWFRGRDRDRRAAAVRGVRGRLGDQARHRLQLRSDGGRRARARRTCSRSSGATRWCWRCTRSRASPGSSPASRCRSLPSEARASRAGSTTRAAGRVRLGRHRDLLLALHPDLRCSASIGSTLAASLAISPGTLILATAPHALLELTAVFLPLAAWTHRQPPGRVGPAAGRDHGHGLHRDPDAVRLGDLGGPRLAATCCSRPRRFTRRGVTPRVEAAGDDRHD